MKRIISVALVLIMLMTLLPMSVLADGSDIASGVFSKNEAISWKIDSSYKLTISGKGEMPYECPWSDYRTKIASVVIKEGITCVRDFEGMSGMKSVTLPSSLEAIAYYAFCDCTALKSIVIPDSVTGIAQGAFAGCTALESVVLPKRFTSIGQHCFSNCTSLKSIVIPENVTDIGVAAFAKCKSLKNIALPASLTTLWPKAFEGCTALSKVYFAGTKEQWNAIDIYDEGNESLINATKVFNSTIPSISVTAGNNASSGKIKLSWNAVSGAAKYEIYRASSKTGSFSKLYTTTNTSYTNTSAKAGYTYYYKIKALDSAGKTIITSSVVSRTCDCAAPAVKATNVSSSGKIKLSWSAVDGASKYEIYRATSKNGTYSKLSTTSKTSYTDTSAKAGNTYYYKVKAISAKTTAANSAFSTIVSKVCDCAAPDVKTSNVQSSGKIKLSWSAIDGAAKYEVYRASSKTGSFTKLYTTTKTSYTNTSAKAGYTYYYKVKAISEKTTNANSAYSSLVSRTCDCAMMNVTIDYSTSGKPVFTWDGVSGAASYKIYRASSSKGTYKLIADTSNLKFTDTGASAGYYYFYKFVAVSSRSSAANSAELKAKIAAAPSQPKNLTKNTGPNYSSSYHNLSWNAVSGADGYLVLIGNSPDVEEMSVWTDTTSTSSVVDRIVNMGGSERTYYVRVVAYCEMSDGNYIISEPSSYIKLTIRV